MSAHDMTSARGARARPSEQGAALVLVTVMGFLALAIFVRAWRGTHDAIRTESYVVARALRDESVGEALAAGIHLLETGRPPSDPYSAVLTVSATQGDVDCTLTWTSAGDLDTWDVSARLATAIESFNLEELPSSF
ncbi:MAG: hypothetical protein DHS20C15_19870 [Planctomycetota bacterium]|nr:MAG: hypothetical protein DHS20C15_19870 [Planctomycetota bacterium]